MDARFHYLFNGVVCLVGCTRTLFTSSYDLMLSTLCALIMMQGGLYRRIIETKLKEEGASATEVIEAAASVISSDVLDALPYTHQDEAIL